MDIEILGTWELIKNGFFEEACMKADFEYAQTGDVFPLRNKIYALLHLRRYEECVSLTNKIIELTNGESDSDYIFCGIANWLLGKREKAISLWRQGEMSKYSDAAGGIISQTILFFASIKQNNKDLKKETLKKIKKLLKYKISLNWPGALGHFIINDIDEEKLKSCVSEVTTLKERQLCQAYFCVAVKELENGNLDGYKRKLLESIGFGPPSYLSSTYYLAKGELEIENG